jgi:hypothetical protein
VSNFSVRVGSGGGAGGLGLFLFEAMNGFYDQEKDEGDDDEFNDGGKKDRI